MATTSSSAASTPTPTPALAPGPSTARLATGGSKLASAAGAGSHDASSPDKAGKGGKSGGVGSAPMANGATGASGAGGTISAKDVVSPGELCGFVDTLLAQLESRFDDMSEQVLGRMNEMSGRIDTLETAIADLMHGGIEGGSGKS